MFCIFYFYGKPIVHSSKLFVETVKGEFAFVLFEFDRLQNIKQIVAGRDQIGVRPMYYHKPHDDSTGLMFCSEIKGMTYFEGKVEENRGTHL